VHDGLKRFWLLAVSSLTVHCASQETPSPVPDRDSDGIADFDDACDGQLYGQRIVRDAGAEVSGLAEALEKMTGRPFTIETFGEQPAGACAAQKTAIHILRTDSKWMRLAPAPLRSSVAALETRLGSHFLWSDPKSGLWISSATDAGLERAMREYRHRLGERWFLPGARWHIYPSRRTVAVAAEGLRVPSIPTMIFAGTGGFGKLASSRALKKRWADWTAANRFPVAQAIECKHTGEAFNSAFQRRLKATPIFRSEVEGRRPLNRISKLHLTHHGNVPCADASAGPPIGGASGECEHRLDYERDGGLVKLFSDWRLSILEKRREWTAVSVEPADGRDHCTCSKCRSLLRAGPYRSYLDDAESDSTPSDLVMHASNHTAQKIERHLPGKGVCQLAYNAHASAPKIPVRPNVYVQLVPHRFHHRFTGMTAMELIASWRQKVETNPWGRFPLGIYDYWNFTDEDLNLPSWPLQRGIDRLAFWARTGLTFVTLETAYSAASVGLPLYAAARQIWEPNLDEASVLKEFTERSFGAAAPAMHRMMSRWNDGFRLDQHELAVSFRDLDEARRALAKPDRASDDRAGARQRVDDFVGYVHYLRLLHELESGSKDRAGKTERLLRHVWRIDDSAMVHGYRVTVLVLKRADTPEPVRKRWRAAADWSKVSPYERAELDDLLDDGLDRYRPVRGFEAREFSQQLTPISPSGDTEDRQPAASAPSGDAEARTLSPTYGVGQSFAFFATNPATLELHVEAPEREPFVRLTIRDESGTIVKRHTARTKVSRIDLAGLAGLHRMRVDAFDRAKDRYRISTPKSLPFANVGATMIFKKHARVPQYFLVPKGTKRVFVSGLFDPRMQPSFEDPSGKKVACDAHGRGLISVAVTRPGIWKVTNLVGPAGTKLLNVPNILASSAEQLLVPIGVQP